MVLFFLGVAFVRAHDPGLSSLHLTARDGTVDVLLQFAPADAALLAPLDADGDGRITRAEFEAARPVLEDVVADWLAVRQADRPLTLLPMSVHLEESDNLSFRALISAPPTGGWTLLLPRLIALPPGHRQAVTVVTADGRKVTEQLVEAGQPWLAITWPDRAGVVPSNPGAGSASAAPTPAGVFWPYVELGVEHILIGYDHLLFLAGLLLACRRFGSMVVIITSFTLAHSLSLALATFDLVSLPGRIVEPLIAASILYVGVENLVRRGEAPPWRGVLTFGFGLIHGLGFASVLRDLGVGGAGRGALGPLLGFNAGVEAGQLAVAALLLPALLSARHHPKFEQRVLPVLSALVALAGLIWLVVRLR